MNRSCWLPIPWESLDMFLTGGTVFFFFLEYVDRIAFFFCRINSAIQLMYLTLEYLSFKLDDKVPYLTLPTLPTYFT